ncbi:class I SAM-dependent methyltransferase [Candidatus Neomarinimicrobiota bacterium]
MLEKFAAVIRETEDASAEKVPEELTGLSGRRLVGTLKNFAQLFKDDPKACYLEVGVYHGLTLLSVANHVADIPCFGVDNFSYKSSIPSNFDIVKSRIEKLALDNVSLINKDFEVAFDEMAEALDGRRIAVYFIDGPHDYRSQLMCLEYALPFLHENAVIVVDDSNYNHVRQANRDFLHNHDEWKILFEAYTPTHPMNMRKKEAAAAREGWWNGVNILVRDQANILANTEPVTIESKIRFFNDHLIHGSKYADGASIAIEAVQYLLNFRFLKARSKLKEAVSTQEKSPSRAGKRYFVDNVDTDQMPTEQFNSAL